ncbi:MAG: DUF1828 domain-containing protein [Thiothrix sp.]|nr:DUF1828 domain-containing protein [Thiothrix sp.]
MTNCQTILSALGFSCHTYEQITILNTPLQSTIDGDLFQLFIEQSPRGWRIRDYGRTLDHAEAHAIRHLDRKARQLHEQFPALFSERGEIAIHADSDAALPAALSRAFNAIQVINGRLPTWKPAPVVDSGFQQQVARYLDSQRIIFKRNQSVIGYSGHEINIPFLIGARDPLSLVHCISQKDEGLPNWDAGYKVSGQMTDIKLTEDGRGRFVIIDDTSMATENFSSLSAIVSGAANILPYSCRSNWLRIFNPNTRT